MAIKSNLNVNVGSAETELIESTETNTLAERIFSIGNGEKEISVTAWGSNPDEDWIEIETKTIGPNGYDTIVLGANHFFNCKLTAKTASSVNISIVDAYFTYTTP
jgi:hypothetical protein